MKEEVIEAHCLGCRGGSLHHTCGKLPDAVNSNDSLYDFPMMDGPNITQELAQQIYKKYSSLFAGEKQSLKSIAERGGFGWAEVEHIWKKCSQRGI